MAAGRIGKGRGYIIFCPSILPPGCNIFSFLEWTIGMLQLKNIPKAVAVTDEASTYFRTEYEGVQP